MKYIRKTQRFYLNAFSMTFLIRYPCMSYVHDFLVVESCSSLDAKARVYVHDFPVVESCSSRDPKARVFITPSLARAFILLSKGSRHSFPGSLAILPNRFHPSSLPSIHGTHVVDFRKDIQWVVLPRNGLDRKLVVHHFLSNIMKAVLYMVAPSVELGC